MLKSFVGEIIVAVTLTSVALAGPLKNATAAYQQVDYAEATAQIARRIAEQGNSHAQFILGKLYINGEGVPQDYVEGVRWLRLAAEQGHGDAASFLGSWYQGGPWEYRNLVEAVKWYRMAAERGHANSQISLGLSYGLGFGVPQDFVLAHMWFSLAAAHQGLENLADVRDFVLSEMTSDQLAQAERLARDWRPKTEPPPTEVATLTGTSAAVDDTEPFEIIRPLAEEGDPTAQVNIGTMYYHGLGVVADYDEAAKWLRFAAEQGDPMGQSLLGQLYFWGHGVPKDYVLSYMWFSLAVAEGDDDSTVWQDAAASQMTSDQIVKAQRLAREWKPWSAPPSGDAGLRHPEVTEKLAEPLAASAEATLAASTDPDAIARISALVADGEAARRSADADGMRRGIADLNALRAALLQTYELRIVSRVGVDTGVFRVPVVNESEGRYYIIVEPVI